ncbi:alpha/beta fold hydrolase [Kineococcus sp. SYSU DK004]|uniref:alpha/beta fold hydrolase n=1 Tax=Kineococcus sp. SYSU DK004 TaxID=3383125 RepID=UPI003D7DE322
MRAHGVRLHHRESTAHPAGAPTVVLVHGLGMSATSVLPLLHELEPHVRVLAPDLPGYGRSQRPPHAPGVGGTADVLREWTRALGVEGAAFVGCSLGAQVVVNLAARHPELLGRAVLVGPTRDPSAPSPWRQAFRLLRDVPNERWSLVPLAVLSYLRAGPRRMWLLLRDALSRSVEDGLPVVRVPTLVVRGEHDPVATQRWVEEVVRLTPGARLRVLPGCGHAPNFSRPRQLAEAVLPFLTGARAEAPEGSEGSQWSQWSRETVGVAR